MAFSSTPGRGTAAASGTAPAMAGTALGASSRRAPCAPSRSMRVAAALPPAVRTGAGTSGTHPLPLEPDAGAGRAFAFRDWKTPAARSRGRLARRAMPARPCRAVTAPATPGRPRTPPFDPGPPPGRQACARGTAGRHDRAFAHRRSGWRELLPGTVCALSSRAHGATSASRRALPDSCRGMIPVALTTSEGAGSVWTLVRLPGTHLH